MKSLKTLLLIVLVTLVFSSFAGAAANLTVWLPGEEGRWMQESGLISRLRAEFPDAQINIVNLPWDVLHDKLLAGFVGGELPDLVFVADQWVGEFAGLGVLEAMDDFKAKAGYKDSQFLPGAWDHFRYLNGKYYGVPYLFEARALFYRTDLFSKAGLSKAPTTWQELMQYGKKLTNGKDQFGLAHQEGWLDFHFFSWLLYSNGGDLYNTERTQSRLADKAAIETLIFYKSLYDNNVIPKNPAKRVETFKGFREGYYAMAESGPWWLGMLKNQAPELKGKWATALLPSNGSSITYGHPQAWVVPKRAKNKQDAFRVIRFFNESKNIILYSRISGQLPCLMEAWKDPFFSENPDAMTMYRAANRGTKSISNIPKAEAISEFIWNTLSKLRDNQISVEQAAKQMNDEMNSVLKK